jgi:RNA polymerase sigma-70 factor (ECF subfamily)
LSFRKRKSYLQAVSDENGMIGELYNRYGKRLYAYATMSWKLNEDDAWDMVYKTLYKVIETHQQYQFENEDKFAAFVFKIFVNFLRNYYRDDKKLSERFHLVEIDEKTLNNIGEKQEIETPQIQAVQLLNELLEQLEDWQRILLLMRSDGRPYSEIAQYINKPESQLKVYYQRLKQDISKKLNERIQ